ncbi:MAG: hypothetical protein ACFFDT_40210 [Candidatus Hodarchaeota archaeon]
MGNGIIVLAAVAISLFLPIIRDYINNRTKIHLERLKLHDKDRIEAYKRLFLLARKLKNISFPLAEHKRRDFERVMLEYYIPRIESDAVYFDSDILKILDEFEDNYICMTAPELIAEIHPEETEEFFEKKLFSLSKELQDLVKQKIKP